jgi:hypothetical protein
MAIITVSGNIGKIIFIPADPKNDKEAILNVGIGDRIFRRGHPQTVWYQACWVGVDAEKKRKIMDRVKSITVLGKEDFKIKQSADGQKLEIERTIWALPDLETLHWKEKDQIEMDLS